MRTGNGMSARLPRAVLVVLFLVAALGGAAMGQAMLLLEGGWRAWERVPAQAHQLVVVRSSEAGLVRTGLAEQSDLRLRSERPAGEVLAEMGVPNAGPELLTVFEVGVPMSVGGPAVLAGLADRDPDVLDVIDLNARERAQWTARRAGRLFAVGLLLAIFAGFAVVGAVMVATESAARWCRDEIRTRLWLGADPARVSGPLGLGAGLAAAAGTLVGLGFAAAMGSPALTVDLVEADLWWWSFWLFVVGLLPLVALATGRLSAHRVVREALRTTLLSGLLLGSPVGAFLGSAEAGELSSQWLESAGVPEGPAQQAALVRSLSRDLAVCRRSRHATRKALVQTGLQAHRASRTNREGLFRLARLKQSEELVFLRAEEERCADLEHERHQAREVLRGARSTDPPIGPRALPIVGAVALAYGEGGQAPGTAGFRNAVGLRASGDEVVRSVARGEVVYAGTVPGVGRVLVVDHGRRTYSVYARIESVQVEVGEEVALGRAMARVRGGLLHFSVRSRGLPVDPLRWIEGAPRG